MISKLTIRKRLVIFGALWLIFCSGVLAYYITSQAESSLMESAVDRSKILARHLAEQSGSSIFSGNQEALELLIKGTKEQPDVLGAMIEYKDKTYGRSVTPLEPVDVPAAAIGNDSHLVEVQHMRAIESYYAITDGFHDIPIAEEGLFRRADGHFQVARATIILSVEPIYKQIHALRVKTFTILLVLLIVGMLMAWAVSGTMISPLRQLAEQVSTIVETVSSHREEGIDPDDEIDLIRFKLTGLKRMLNQKEKEFNQLHHQFDNQLRNDTADLQERNRELSEILKLKNDLILELKHEVKTPLASLSTHIANFYDAYQGELSDVQKDRLQRMKSTSERVNRLLTDVLEFAVRETGKIELKQRRVNLADLAGQVLFLLESMQEEMKVQCVISDRIKGRYVNADPDHVEQILLNLVHNAIKASPPGSKVTIDVREDGPLLEISITDSGFGIAEELKPKLFLERFVTDGKDGTGVGLFITRFLVELHSGRIWFKSENGKGTTFSFTLPRIPSKIEAEI